MPYINYNNEGNLTNLSSIRQNNEQIILGLIDDVLSVITVNTPYNDEGVYDKNLSFYKYVNGSIILNPQKVYNSEIDYQISSWNEFYKETKRQIDYINILKRGYEARYTLNPELEESLSQYVAQLSIWEENTLIQLAEEHANFIIRLNAINKEE